MEQIHHTVQQAVDNIKNKNQNALATNGLEKNEKQQKQEEKPLILKRLSTISEQCPYHMCNGFGAIGYLVLEDGQEVERWKVFGLCWPI